VTRPATTTAPAGDLVLVIMPLYGHAALVQEAIVSVREAVTPGLRVKIIVSVDGDPRQEAFHQLLCAGLGTDDVHVLFGANGGPGAARNRAIEFALRQFPDAVASYFLDADNRLLGPTLARLHARLKESGAGWAYTNIDAFSVEWRAHYGTRYSRLAHCITDNICDTGSLVSQAVFRAGIRFHEDRSNGFEDWDFWLSCIEAGFVGVPCQEAGFEYRLRAESRYKEASRSRQTSMDFLRKHHRSLFRRDTLVGFEHEESPRYALIVPGQDQLLTFSDPTLPPQRLDLNAAMADFWSSQSEPDNAHFPPYVLACSQGVLHLLQQSRMLPNILCHAERLAETHNTDPPKS
jgi:glycosyltransferase involved in cell wall biosynthesis